MSLFDEVRDILDGILDFEPDEIILPEFLLVDDLRFEDPDYGYLKDAIEERYAANISEEDLKKLESIGDLVDYLAKHKK